MAILPSLFVMRINSTADSSSILTIEVEIFLIAKKT